MNQATTVESALSEAHSAATRAEAILARLQSAVSSGGDLSNTARPGMAGAPSLLGSACDLNYRIAQIASDLEALASVLVSPKAAPIGAPGFGGQAINASLYALTPEQAKAQIRAADNFMADRTGY